METIKITLHRSRIGTLKKHKKIIEALGLRKINQSVVHNNTPSIRGMIHKVSHMFEVVPVKKPKLRKPEDKQPQIGERDEAV